MRTKKLQKKRYVKKESGFSKHKNEITGIILLAIGALLFCSVYLTGSIGFIGEYVRKFLFGILGLCSYFVPPIILISSIAKIIKKDDATFKARMLYSVILVILISATIQTGFYKPSDYENRKFLDCVILFYHGNGGGVIGGLISLPFIMAFKSLGTIIILTTLSIIDLILLTNISPMNLMRNLHALFAKGEKKNKIKLEKEKAQIYKENEIGFEPDIVVDDDSMRLEFKPKSKIIDFKIEKTSREIKEKTDYTDIAACEDKQEGIEQVAFHMKEIKKNEGVEGIKNDKKREIEGIVKNQHLLNYHFPEYDILSENADYGKNIKNYKTSALEAAKKLEDTLNSFGVEAKVINISRGPAVTRYELQPSPGVKVSKIVNLADDISLNLASSGVRIEAPIPGKAAIGIEVPNKVVTQVHLREVIESPEFLQFPSKLAFAVGKDISGDNVVADISKMPHLLIAGATGSGKSVCINSLIVSLLYKATPDEVKLLMIDPKVVELGIYNGIPHLLIPVVTDPRKAAGALNWAVQEMINRYKLFAEKGARDLKGYNSIIKEEGEALPLPQIVILIDELADLMMVAPNEVEDAICRLAQMARAAGMHLVIATQRPSVDVITGVIKANIPSRISFAVSSQIDSRTILDMGGAEKLQGKGDMLFYPVGEPKPVRLKGCFVSDKEVETVVNFIKEQCKAEYDHSIIDEIDNCNESTTQNQGDKDELLAQAIEIVVDAGQASVSLIQRKFKVGYARAARMIDQMEARGIVGGFEGSKPRQVLISKQQWQELKMADGY